MKHILPLRFYLSLVNGLFFAGLFLVKTNLFAQAPGAVIFRDDFNRTTLGNDWQTNNWFVVNGATFNGAGGPLSTTTTFSDASYVIETAAKGFTNNYFREFRITFGQADFSKDSMYVLRYTQYGGGTLSLGRSADNVFFPVTLDEVAVYPDFNATQWYKFKIAKYKSGLIQVYVDKGTGYGTMPLLEAIDLAYPILGHFGWREDTQTFPVPFYVDWIAAAKPVTEKPAVREKPTADNLITQVSAESGRTYKVAKLNTGITAFTDRNYKVTALPAYLKGGSFVQTAMDDKYQASNTFLTLFLKKAAVVYIAYDPRATVIPAWLKQWTKTGDVIGTRDPGAAYLEVYSRLTEANEVYPHPLLLGANLASPAIGAQMNFIVVAVERPVIPTLQAEDAFLSGAVVAKNHINYQGTGFADYVNLSNDYIEWTVNVAVPGTYNVGFGYANGGLTNRPLQISDNGVSIATLPFGPVGSWDTWAFLSGPNIFLTNGIHKIKAAATGSNGPNIDYLSLNYSSAAAPAKSVARSAELTKLSEHSVDHFTKVYPNPFVKSTTIYYTVKEKANVLLSIYSLQGQQLQVLVNGSKDVGNHQATFNATAISAGVYFYRLQTGNEVKVGKLLKQ